MFQRLLPVLVIALLMQFATAAQAVQDFDEQIQGKWRASSAKTRTYLKLPSLASDSDEDFLKEIGKITVEFGGDQTVIVHEGGDGDKKGEWKLVKDEDGQVEIDLYRDEEEAVRAKLEFLDKDSVAISVKNERAIVFIREQAKSPEHLSEKLVGTWDFDKTATLALESNKKFSEDELADMLREAAEITISFEQDGSFHAKSITGEEGKDLKGTWSCTNPDKDKIVFELSAENGGGPSGLKAELRDDGRICISPEGEAAAVFVRTAKEAEKLP